MAVAFAITYTLEDDAGKSATFEIHIPTAFSLSQYTEFIRAMADLVDNIVSGLMTSADLTISVDISALTLNNALPDSDVEEVASYQFITGDNRPVQVNIPGLDEGETLAGSDDLNVLAPNQAAFITAMETGVAVTGGTISPCDINEDDLTELVYAREEVRSSGKRR